MGDIIKAVADVFSGSGFGGGGSQSSGGGKKQEAQTPDDLAVIIKGFPKEPDDLAKGTKELENGGYKFNPGVFQDNVYMQPTGKDAGDATEFRAEGNGPKSQAKAAAASLDTSKGVSIEAANPKSESSLIHACKSAATYNQNKSDANDPDINTKMLETQIEHYAQNQKAMMKKVLEKQIAELSEKDGMKSKDLQKKIKELMKEMNENLADQLSDLQKAARDIDIGRAAKAEPLNSEFQVADRFNDIKPDENKEHNCFKKMANGDLEYKTGFFKNNVTISRDSESNTVTFKNGSPEAKADAVRAMFGDKQASIKATPADSPDKNVLMDTLKIARKMSEKADDNHPKPNISELKAQCEKFEEQRMGEIQKEVEGSKSVKKLDKKIADKEDKLKSKKITKEKAAEIRGEIAELKSERSQEITKKVEKQANSEFKELRKELSKCMDAGADITVKAKAESKAEAQDKDAPGDEPKHKQEQEPKPEELAADVDAEQEDPKLVEPAAPAEDEPAPAEDEPAPAEDEPALAEDEPAPEEVEPAPEEVEPAPEEVEPAPAEQDATPKDVELDAEGPAPAAEEPAVPRAGNMDDWLDEQNENVGGDFDDPSMPLDDADGPQVLSMDNLAKHNELIKEDDELDGLTPSDDFDPDDDTMSVDFGSQLGALSSELGGGEDTELGARTEGPTGQNPSLGGHGGAPSGEDPMVEGVAGAGKPDSPEKPAAVADGPEPVKQKAPRSNL